MPATIRLLAITLAAASLAVTGCSRGAKVWTEKTFTLDIPSADVTALEVATHNGSIAVRGGERSAIQIRAKCRAGGRTQTAADECLAAVELISIYAGEGTHKIGWRWREPQHSDWSASVAFEADVPAGLALTAVSHNGALEARDLAADCRLTTQNGAIVAVGLGASIDATTHNGSITCSAVGPRVRLISHNGAIHLTAANAPTLTGTVETHNGQIVLAVGPDTSADLDCTTDNGRITCDAPVTATENSRTHLRGKLRGGGETLRLTSRNGSIRIHQ